MPECRKSRQNVPNDRNRKTVGVRKECDSGGHEALHELALKQQKGDQERADRLIEPGDEATLWRKSWCRLSQSEKSFGWISN